MIGCVFEPTFRIVCTYPLTMERTYSFTGMDLINGQ